MEHSSTFLAAVLLKYIIEVYFENFQESAFFLFLW